MEVVLRDLDRSLRRNKTNWNLNNTRGIAHNRLYPRFYTDSCDKRTSIL